MDKTLRPTILIVDDIESNVQIIDYAVRGLHVNVIKALSGQEALEKIKGRDLALALIDMEMPGMGGQELARLIHSDPARDLVPVIFVTAYSFHELHLEKYYETGIIDFIIKPFHKNILVSKIKILLELYRQKQEVKVSGEMYRMLLDASPEGIIIMNVDGEIREISTIALKVFNIKDKQEFIGRHITEMIPAEEHGHVEQMIRTTIAEGLTQNVEFSLTRADQKQFYAEISTKLILNDSGDPQALMTIIRDITERKRQEQKLIHTERLAGLGEMAAGIAHEINQPLNTISIGLENLLHEVLNNRVDAVYLQHKADKIFENISRIDHIIDHIRTFSRSNDGELNAAFSINESIGNALGMIAGQLKHKGIDLIVELDNSLPPVMGNTYKFEQVIINLLMNAKDALEDRQKKVGSGWQKIIGIKSSGTEMNLFVEVSDNGIGIKRHELDKIMLPFHTTKEAGKGTGLGLSISFGIIREMNGNIEVTSKPQAGTTIRIVIPKTGNSETEP
jgi:PAS domain S-box-containing protein